MDIKIILVMIVAISVVIYVVMQAMQKKSLSPKPLSARLEGATGATGGRSPIINRQNEETMKSLVRQNEETMKSLARQNEETMKSLARQNAETINRETAEIINMQKRLLY